MKILFARNFSTLLLVVSLGLSTAFGIHSEANAQTEFTGEPVQQPVVVKPAKAPTPSDAWKGYLHSAEQALGRKNLTDAQFEAFDLNVEKIIVNALEQIQSLTPEHTQLNQRLAELGPTPKDDEPNESDDLIKLRESLGADFAIVDGQIKDARQIIIRANQLKSNALKKRRSKFVKSITSKTQKILVADFWLEFADGFYDLGNSFRLLIKDTAASMVNDLSKSRWKIFVLAFGLVLGTLIYLFIRRKIGEYFPKPDQADDLTRKQAVAWATAKFARFGLLKTGALIYIHTLFSNLELMPAQFEKFSGEVVFSLSAFFITSSLAKVFLDQNNSQSRVVNLTSSAAESIQRTIIISIAIIALLDGLNFSAVLLVFPFEMSIGLSALLAIIGSIAITGVLTIAQRDRSTNPPEIFQEGGLIRWSYLKIILWAGVISTVLSLMFNYVALAEFIILQLIAGSIVFAVLWLVLELIDTNRQTILTDGRFSSSPSQTSEAQPSRLKQMAILGFGIAKILAFVIAFAALSLPWGIRTNDWLQWLNGAFFGFQIGDLTISFATILLAVVLFLAGYTVTRLLKSWLSTQYLPATNIEFGLRNSISTVFGYVGYTVAAMMAISAVGLDMSSFAIVAGALSVGVGFGLQSIVNNFVSGLILLAERPIKVGDWVITGGGEGIVRKISVRSTEIQTFDRSTVVVPNSTLITDPITNWTHSSKLGRIRISIGVGYDSDPDQVRDILLKCMGEQSGVLKKPSPSVFFLDFADNALLFEVRGFLSNIENGLGVRSDIRFAILRELRAAKIEIPYPQRDIHIKTDASSAPPAPKPPTRSSSAPRAKKSS